LDANEQKYKENLNLPPRLNLELHDKQRFRYAFKVAGKKYLQIFLKIKYFVNIKCPYLLIGGAPRPRDLCVRRANVEAKQRFQDQS
jgi:hypothetical protein